MSDAVITPPPLPSEPPPPDPPAAVTAPTVAETAEAAGRLAKGWRLRNLARRAREVQLSGHALIGAGMSMTVLAGATLLWGGIVTGAPRVILLLMSAAMLSLRLLIVRLGAMTPADGMDAAAPRSGPAGWLGPVEGAVLMVAGGLNPFGSGSDIAPVLGLIAAGLLLMASLRLRTARAVFEPSRPNPTTLLAIACLASTVEPLWGWRGQTLLIGLCVISAVLIVQAVRAPRPASA